MGSRGPFLYINQKSQKYAIKISKIIEKSRILFL